MHLLELHWELLVLRHSRLHELEEIKEELGGVQEYKVAAEEEHLV